MNETRCKCRDTNLGEAGAILWLTSEKRDEQPLTEGTAFEYTQSRDSWCEEEKATSYQDQKKQQRILKVTSAYKVEKFVTRVLMKQTICFCDNL